MAFTCGHQVMGLTASAAFLSAAPGPQQHYSRTTVSPQLARRDVRLAGPGLFASGNESGRALWESAAGKSSVQLRCRSTGGVNPTRTRSALIGDEESTAPSDVQDPSDSTTLKVVQPTLINQLVTRLQPFWHLARLDSLLERGGAGWILYYSPFAWGTALAAPNGSGPDWKLLGLFGVASLILHVAAVIINDLCDKDFDAQVERSKQRPLVTGAVTVPQGWTFLGTQIFLYLGVLLQSEAFSLGDQTMQVLVAIQMFLQGTYPLAKRWTHWTPAYLGLAVNWGAVLGWAAVRGTADLASSAPVLLPAFAALMCWTLEFETIYAHQDIKDDVKAGVKSMAVLFGKDSRLWVTGFITAFAACLSLAGYNAASGWPFYVGVAAATGHMAWQITTVDLENPEDCGAKFCSNSWVGAIVTAGIVCGQLLA